MGSCGFAGRDVEHILSFWTADAVVIPPGLNTVTMNTPNGMPVTTVGRAVTIWRRESDGEWRCAVDIWNAQPAT